MVNLVFLWKFIGVLSAAPLLTVEVPTGPGGAFGSISHPLGIPLQDSDQRMRLYGLRPIPALAGKTPALFTVDGGTRNSLYALGQPPGLGTGGVSFGAYQDNRSLSYLDDKHTLYDSSDDVRAFIRPETQHYYSTVSGHYGGFQAQVDFDYLKQNALVGSWKTGTAFRREWNFASRWEKAPGKPTLFWFPGFSNFHSETADLPSSETSTQQFGIRSEWDLPFHLGLQAGVRREAWNRASEGRAGLDLGRTVYETELGVPKAGEIGQWKWLPYTSALVAVENSNTASRVMALWQFGESLQWKYFQPLLLEWSGLRYSRLPSPVQVFGDGYSILPNLSLPPESGYRMALGPKLHLSDQQTVAIHIFYDRTADRLAPLASTPTSIRYENIGATTVYGLLLTGKWQLGKFQLEGGGALQDSINQSAVRWQNGTRVPGRPMESAHFSLGYESGAWRAGARYDFWGREAFDIAGLYILGNRDKMHVTVGQTYADWKWSLDFDQWLRSPLESLQFQGAAAPLVFQQLVSETEIKLSVEVGL